MLLVRALIGTSLVTKADRGPLPHPADVVVAALVALVVDDRELAESVQPRRKAVEDVATPVQRRLKRNLMRKWRTISVEEEEPLRTPTTAESYQMARQLRLLPRPLPLLLLLLETISI